MKKLTLPILAFVAFIVTSCAKEKDGYDKNLTGGTWNLSSSIMTSEKITNYDYSNGNDDRKETERESETFSGGVLTFEDYYLEQVVNQADFFTRDIETSNVSTTYTFEADGTFTVTSSTQLTSTSHEETGIPIVTVTQTNTPEDETYTELWSWKNDADQKSQLTFDGPTFHVESISKNELVLKLNISSSKTTMPNSSLVQTETETGTYQLTFTR